MLLCFRALVLFVCLVFVGVLCVCFVVVVCLFVRVCFVCLVPPRVVLVCVVIVCVAVCCLCVCFFYCGRFSFVVCMYVLSPRCLYLFVLFAFVVVALWICFV